MMANKLVRWFFFQNESKTIPMKGFLLVKVGCIYITTA